MTINPRAAKMLREARTRMRDAAAAEHAVAQSGQSDAARRLETEHQSLANTIDEAGAQLANARTVHDLDQVAMMINAHKYAIDDAVKSHDDARAAAELTAGKLRERARQLATAERIVEIAVRTRSEHEARQEQRASDDIGGRTRR